MIKQTAIEWLITKAEFNKHFFNDDFYSLLSKAKEIEKEQIKDAWLNGNAYEASQNTKAELYYIKTYINENYDCTTKN